QFNAYYDIEEAPDVDGKSWKLEVRGLVENKKSWTLEELYQLPQVKQITRHICIEGWSAIGSWTGTPLRDFLKIVGADTRAKYVWFQCSDKEDRKSTRLNSSHRTISYAVFCLKKKTQLADARIDLFRFLWCYFDR